MELVGEEEEKRDIKSSADRDDLEDETEINSDSRSIGDFN